MEADLGPVVGWPNPTKPVRPVVMPRKDYVELFMSGFLALLRSLAVLVIAGAAVLFVWLYSVFTAKAQTPVPPECVALAKREGFPTKELSEADLDRARWRMGNLSPKDPLVLRCRVAVKRIEARRLGASQEVK